MRSRSLTSLLAATAFVAAVPASAEARSSLLSSLFKPVKTTTTAVTPPTTTATTTAASTATAAAAVTTAAVSEMTEVCADTPTFKAFKAFGDNADYAFAPGGSFESGATGWSLSGASVASANDTSGVFGGTKALKINDGGVVVSPWFCVTPANPHFRFVTYGGEVEMEIEYKVIGDNDIDDDLVGETNGGGNWAPSAQHELATEIPNSKLAKGVLARIIFEAEDTIFVDNVLVDPYRRG